MEDIAPGLLKDIRETFTKKINSSKQIAALHKVIQNGTATYADAEDYAYLVGDALSQTFGKHLASAVLPNGKMYFNIADRVLRPMLHEDHSMVADAAATVQQSLNQQAGIGLKAQMVTVNEDRIDGIINSVSSADSFDDVSWVLNEPVKLFSQMVVDDTLKANVNFQGKAGLQPKIIRKAERKCCAWCQSLAGEYDYPDLPDDIYRRHENCRCTVEYDPGSGKRQNVHTKKWTSPEDDAKMESRKNLRVKTGTTSSRRFNSKGDPMAEETGPAEISHPNEIAAFQKEIEESNVELIRKKHESLGYCPGLQAGAPGQLHISEGASYSAWCHEMQHMREDRAAGWKGLVKSLEDKDERFASEQRAYGIEIDMAREAKRDDIVSRLQANLEEERKSIYGNG